MSFKIPTDPSLAKSYKLWRKDALVWQKITDTPKAKQGLVLQYACQANERIHEAVMDIEETKVVGDDGFKNVLDVLDGLFKVDDKESEMQIYHDFESIRRDDQQTIADFINQFDSLLTKTKSYGNQMSENLLASKLMTAANLTRSQQHLIKASTEELTYTNVKTIMKRTFGESTSINKNNADELTIKSEPTLQSSHIPCKNQNHQALDENDEDSADEILYGYNRKFKSNVNRNIQMG